MNEANPKSAVELELKRLEKRLEDLIVTVAQIKEENRALRQRQETLTSERASLLQKNEQVRAQPRLASSCAELRPRMVRISTVRCGWGSSSRSPISGRIPVCTIRPPCG